jgi:hypothetical protein
MLPFLIEKRHAGPPESRPHDSHGKILGDEKADDNGTLIKVLKGALDKVLGRQA